MKDLTHYFQAPKATPSSSEGTATKTLTKCKRKASESIDPDATKSSSVCNEDTPEDEIFKTKKPRKSIPSSKKKTTKPNLNDTSLTNGISDDENTPISKRTKKCNGDVTNDSTPVQKVRTYRKKKPQEVVEPENDSSFEGIRTYKKKKSQEEVESKNDSLFDSKRTYKKKKSQEEVESKNDTSFDDIIRTCENKKPQEEVESKNDISCEAIRTYENKNPQEAEGPKIDSSIVGMNFDVRVVLDDCLQSSQPAIKLNESVETEGSDSESCFVSEKKPKKSSKTKNDKEDELGKNNLFNYFAKVDKVQNNNHVNKPTVITVQAIVHSPPKDKSKVIKERDPNVPEVSPVLSKKSKKKKSCNFDDIKVIEEVIKDDDTSTKNSETVPTTPQPQIENVSPENTSSKGKSWKMRVKLTPSSKLDAVIVKSSKSKKYKKIIASNSSDDEDTENKSGAKSSDNDVQFVSESKPDVVKLQPSPDTMKSQKDEKSQPIKLAPLFCKRTNTKSTTNRFRISDEAKRQFLESGVPEAIKKKMEEQKNIVEEEYKGEYVFPKCNHIQQKDTESFIWNLKECLDFKLKESEDDIQFEELLRQSYSSLITNNVELNLDQNNVQKVEFDIKNEINSLKKQEPNANVSDIHSSIKRLKKVSESVNDICWTQKYNPFVFGDMIGNTSSLNQLKEWIESHKRIKQVVLESDSSSGGEFYDSDDSCSSTDVKNNIAILVGPPGCGKTCAVYMLANELGFKVLEVNAGSNRAGKKIIDELLEATQSHRVKRTSGSMFNSQPEKSRKKKKGKETKKEKKTMSLILIEDADILFENHDEGFLSALNSLTSLSKRPLIFTVNNLNYPHLHKYNNAQNLILRFDYPSRASINAWLKVIALVEGVPLTDDVLIELYKIAGSDLRKNLLQLQMFIQSKCQYPKSNNEQLFYQDWLSHVRCLGDKRITPKLNTSSCENPHEKLFSDDETTPSDDFKKPLSIDEVIVKPKSKSELRSDREALLESVKFLDYAANLDNFANDNNQKIFPTRVCLAKDDNYFNYRINSDVMEFIKKNIFEKYEEEKAPFSFKKYFNAVAQNSRIKTVTENVFLSFNPRISSQQVRSCDYLPTIRNIARSEKNRVPSLRRSNRYFGYLKSVSIDITEKETEILCNTFVS